MEKTISYKEHEKLGQMLKNLTIDLNRAWRDIFKNSKSKAEGYKRTRHYTKALKAIDNFRCQMEEVIFLEYENSTSDVYYGNRSVKKDV